MAVIAVPTTVFPTGMEFGLVSNAWRFTSPYTGHSQAVVLPGARWRVTLSWNTLHRSQAGAYEAFLTRLRGGEHQFSVYNYFRPHPIGTLRGTLTVSGAHQAGAQTVTVTGGAGQANATLKAGDYVSINGELKMVRTDATANGSGVISVAIEPPMRAALSGNESVVWDRPTATFMPNERSVAWQYEQGFGRAFVLAGEEFY